MEGGIYKATVYQKSGRTDFEQLQNTASIHSYYVNEGTNSLVTNKSESDGLFVMHGHKTSVLKFMITMVGSQDWWCRFPPSLVYHFCVVRTYVPSQ